MLRNRCVGKKTRILFLCTGNSCRSQMAEGFARHLRGDVVEAFSAGTRPQSLNLQAVRVMQEIGIDISGQTPRSIDQFQDREFDFIVTVCDDAHEHCPYWPGQGKVVHHGFDDPPRLAAEARSPDEALDIYRRVRDEVRDFVRGIPGNLVPPSS
ncbi:MAG: arsenate reductase ArsC [Deltaproteobacteria bacterium]|nr:arsenate reductase ArsC [Deltaproteobacteria bacterium]